MRYHYKKPNSYSNRYGSTYFCDHPIYDRCTLYIINNRGLSVIQQRFDENNKSTYWTQIDPWLVDSIYLEDGFLDYFNKFAKTCENGLYPTVTIRQIMWALKMKPIKRQRWETCFDRKILWREKNNHYNEKIKRRTRLCFYLWY